MRPATRRAFEETALPHLPALYSMAVRLTRDDPAAQDLVQDTMVKAFRFFHRFEEGSNAKAWLLKVLVNLFYNQYHKGKRDRRLADEAESEESYERFVSAASLSGRDPEGDLLDRLSRDRLRAAVATLPEEYRTVVLLCDVEGLAYREIADAVGCPIGTVMSRLFRARRALQRMLVQEAIDAGITVKLADYRRKKEPAS